MFRTAMPLLIMTFSLTSMGCGREKINQAGPLFPVKGNVTFDGAPLEEASIAFVPVVNDGLGNEGGNIINGAYSANVRVGKMKVMISVPRGAKVEHAIPAAYNSETTLTAEITASGPNEFNFDLKSD